MTYYLLKTYEASRPAMLRGLKPCYLLKTYDLLPTEDLRGLKTSIVEGLDTTVF
jgi:hypothetical protein